MFALYALYHSQNSWVFIREHNGNEMLLTHSGYAAAVVEWLCSTGCTHQDRARSGTTKDTDENGGLEFTGLHQISSTR